LLSKLSEQLTKNLFSLNENFEPLLSSDLDRKHGFLLLIEVISKNKESIIPFLEFISLIHKREYNQ